MSRNPNDYNSTISLQPLVEKIDKVSGFVKSRNLFDISYTDNTSIMFDKIENSVTLLPSANRRGGDVSYGKDDVVSTFALPIGYFPWSDKITKQDYQDKRKAGTDSEADNEANVTAGKLKNGKLAMDQTHEYMMLETVKGNCVTPDGVSLANMFSLFGETQIEIDFLLGTAATNVDGKVAELKRTIAKNNTTGASINGLIDVIVGEEFFDKLISHSSVQQAYLNSTSNVRYQETLSTYQEWGVSDMFEYRGVRFITYSHTFKLPDGSTKEAVEAADGHALPNIDGLFRGVYGPSQNMDINGGAEMFAQEYRDPKGRYKEIMMETSPLFYCVNPLVLVKVTTSD